MPKYRFVEHYDPIHDRTIWWSEVRGFLWLWDYVNNSLSSDKEVALRNFERVKQYGTKGAKRVLEVVEK